MPALWKHPGRTSIPSAWCQTFARQRQPRVSPGEALAGASLLCSCHEHPPELDHRAVRQHHSVSLSSPTRGPPLPANTQLSAPERCSSPFCSKFSPPGPSSGTARTTGRGLVRLDQGCSQPRLNTRSHPAKRHGHISEVQPHKGEENTTGTRQG